MCHLLRDRNHRLRRCKPVGSLLITLNTLRTSCPPSERDMPMLQPQVGILRFVNFLDRTFGRCPKCVRKAFLSAICASALAFTFSALSGPSWVVAPMMVAALCLTALWLAHIGAFGLRTASAVRRASMSASKPTPGAFSRRRFLAEFARAAVVVTIATALTARPNTVTAQRRCDCSRCRSDQYCCPTAQGYCGCFPFPCP